MISTDHPMNLPIGRFLGKGGLEHWQKVRARCEEKFGADQIDVLFPASAYQLTHNALFPHDCVHVENLGGEIGNPKLHNRRLTLGAFPWLFKGGEAAFCRAAAWLEE
jgi:kynurenine formamidase